MAHVHQNLDWRNSISEFRTHAAWSSMAVESKLLVETFDRELEATILSGSRANIVTPFSLAVRAILDKRPVVVDPCPAAVELAPGLTRTSDISFSYGGQKWVIEIKTGLEFNSLGAATLEAFAFRAIDPTCKFVLLSLYGKWRQGNLLEVLRRCAIEHVFDEIHVLSNNADQGDLWFDNFATNLNLFTNSLPSD